MTAHDSAQAGRIRWSKGASLPNLYSNAFDTEAHASGSDYGAGNVRMTCRFGSFAAAGIGFTSAGSRGACCWHWLLPAVRACCLSFPWRILVASTSVIRTTTTAPAAVASISPAAAAAAVSGHLGETGVDLLLGLLE